MHTLTARITQTLAIRLARRKWLAILNDRQVTLLRWDGERHGERIRFANSGEGAREAARFLADKAAPVLFLADLQEEDLHRETVPSLMGTNRRDLIDTRLRRLFRATPFRLAESQGRGQPGHERVLFCGLTQPERIEPWLRLAREHRLPVVGLWSVPLLARALLRLATPIRAASAVLIHFNAEGQRQVCFHEGRTILGRMIPGLPADAAARAEAIRTEVARTRMYLASLRLLPREAALSAFVILPDADAAILAERLAAFDDPLARYHPLRVSEVARRIGAGPLPEGGGEIDLLYARLLMRGRHGESGYPVATAAGIGPWLPGWLRERLTVPGPTPEGAHAALPLPARRLGEILVEQRAISRDQLEIALNEQNRTRQPLGKVLVTLGFLSEIRMRDLLGEVLSQESVDLRQVTLDPEMANLIPKEFARRHGVVPVSWSPGERHLVVAMTNTLDMPTLDRLMARLPSGVTVTSKLATESGINEALDRLYGFELSVDGILREIESGEVDLASLSSGGSEFTHPVVRLVNALLVDAIRREASDIHFGPMAGFLEIRYRLDGVLHPVRSLPQKFQAAITVRLKVMAGMDISETRLPQDGHFDMAFGATMIDFRCSSQPTLHGENLVLRVLDRARRILSLEALGLSARNRVILDHMMSTPEGIILVTGPTGSGKTTTLYSMISSLNARERNIMTQEDPVEYPMPYILQTSVNEAIRLDFASGIRSILRQDPDVILVGEIRDLETAQMALRAAMT
ncbi:MAG: Flp pilus assembly complex ATPase component TadA, partial [Magnetococcales bacterium]|nr:Flp pilus assembly complex ATPase component TadA [Magnetococcales bacterium]